MHKFLLLTAPFALLASPAAAQSVDGQVDINGTVTGRCMFTNQRPDGGWRLQRRRGGHLDPEHRVVNRATFA